MLHGNPTWSFYYRTLVKGLSSKYRTIVPDHIGCGYSEKPPLKKYDYRLKSRVDDLERLVDHLDLDRNLTLILHDWGGAIGMAYALRHPRKIARLILFNTAAFLMPPGKKLPLRLRLVRDCAPLAALAVLGFNLFARAALVMASSRGLAGAVKAGLVAPYNSWRNRLATLKFVQDIPLNEQDPSYSEIKYLDDNLSQLAHLPTLILWGGHDFVFDNAYLAEWKRRIPRAEVHVFQQAGHYVLEDEPDRILTLVNEFLLRHPVRDTSPNNDDTSL
jgi:haloalkane dehalogenase